MEETEMRKRIVAVVVLAVLMAPSTYAQTTNFFVILQNGTPEAVQAAIDQGTDVNAVNTAGQTPLIVAAYHNPNPGVITTLLKAGAELEARDPMYGITALGWAAGQTSNPEVITVLLNAGADPKAKDIDGYTPIYAARMNANLKGTDALKQLEEASK
jgi:ankyrin repeat protein